MGGGCSAAVPVSGGARAYSRSSTLSGRWPKRQRTARLLAVRGLATEAPDHAPSQLASGSTRLDGPLWANRSWATDELPACRPPAPPPDAKAAIRSTCYVCCEAYTSTRRFARQTGVARLEELCRSVQIKPLIAVQLPDQLPFHIVWGPSVDCQADFDGVLSADHLAM